MYDGDDKNCGKDLAGVAPVIHIYPQARLRQFNLGLGLPSLYD